MPTKKINCSACGQEYEYGLGYQGKCVACSAKDRQERISKELASRIKRLRAQFQRECNLPSMFLTKTFKNFDNKLQPKAYKAMYNWMSCEWCDKFGKGDICKPGEGCSISNAFLLLSPGLYGVGKTHLVAAFMNRLWEDDSDYACIDSTGHIKEYECNAYFISEPQLLSRIRSTFNKDAPETEEEVYYSLTKKYEYLAIDDIGKVKPRDISFLQSVYFRIIDDFYTQESNNIILTTNLDFKEFEAHIGGASADRLVEMCNKNIIKMTGQSYRTTKHGL